MITLTIDGREIRLDRRMTVLEAAKANGIAIPYFCDHPMLEKFGGCRMCLVEVENMRKLQTSCTLIASDGMVVKTNTPEVVKARKAMLEFILINHPLDCGHCDKAGECDLQDLTVMYGPAAGRFEETKWKEPESTKDPLIVRNMERCIMCTKCVRMCDNVQGAAAISVVGRGKNSYIEPFSGKTFDCDYCGSCVTVCPVGALMSRLHRFDYRPWETTRKVPSICPHCGVGCTTVVQVRGEDIQRAMPQFGLGLNKGVLCSRGYFGWEFVDSRDRLTTPLIKKGGEFRTASWEEAYDLVAEKLSAITKEHGGSAIAAIASPLCTNEDNYVLQKVMRTAFNSNNIDSTARLGFAGSKRLLESVLGRGSTSNMISGIANSDTVLVIGADPTTVNPVLGVRVRNAFRQGATVITIGHMPGLKNHTSIKIHTELFGEPDAAETLLKPILEKHPLERCYSTLASTLDIAGVPSPADKTYDGLQEAIEALSTARSISLIISPDLMAHPSGGPRAVLVTAALASALDARVYLMAEGANDNGLLDMGCEPDRLPGGQPVHDADVRRSFEEAWGWPVSMNKGETLTEFMEGAAEGRIRGMYIIGSNPAFGLPDSQKMTKALESLDFLVVHDLFLTETAQLADVVLPSTGWPQKRGTYVNTERRMQTLKPAISHKGREDWRMLMEVGKRAGLKLSYSSEADIMNEIASLVSLFDGLTYDDIEQGMDLWPYKGNPAPAVPFEPDAAVFSKKTLTLSQEVFIIHDRPLHMKGTMSRYSPALLSVYPEPQARTHPVTAAGLGLSDGDMVKVSTDLGSLELKTRLDNTVPENAIFLSNSFRDNGIFSLLSYNREPFSGAPVIPLTGTTIIRVG